MDLEQEMVMTAPTVEEAIILGLARLGLTREEADIEVLDEGSKGFLGLGVREARVHVKRRTETARQDAPVAEPGVPEPAPEPEAAPPPEPTASVSHLTGGSSLAPAGAPVEKPPLKSVEGKAVEKPRREGPQLEKPASTRPAPETVAPAVKAPRAVAEPADREAIRETVLDIATHFFEALELQVSVDWRDEGALWVSVRGKDADVLVGPQAQTLDTTQYLLRTVAHHQAPGTYDLVLDADGYRERRLRSLATLARNTADKAVKMGRPIQLRPMPASDRRVIHITLQDDARVKTQSTGSGNARAVTVIPVTHEAQE